MSTMVKEYVSKARVSEMFSGSIRTLLVFTFHQRSLGAFLLSYALESGYRRDEEVGMAFGPGPHHLSDELSKG